ncbi:Hsp20/alpha crystallin family protein [Roseovarius pacificus]|uniref:Hsp20/alpha crystallin family protein n=1 Tax=Roseovarius pacificus TaxID=337701 RepID=UPI002A18B90A|nr:Hsp20/alpha crystallin family protein [Roseovarius pacificus]
MVRTTWNPLGELDALRREVERAFEDFGATGALWNRPFSRVAFLPQLPGRGYPLLNLNEDADNLYVDVLAPGLDPESIDVSVVRDVLRISGEKAAINAGIKPEAYHRTERGAGRFSRTITLPAQIESEKVTAAYENGVMRLTLPKHEQAKPKQISVSVN